MIWTQLFGDSGPNPYNVGWWFWFYTKLYGQEELNIINSIPYKDNYSFMANWSLIELIRIFLEKKIKLPTFRKTTIFVFGAFSIYQ